MNSDRLRTLLALGRVSNLPTLWSDCLAGWWLSGGGRGKALPGLFLGTTLLYLAGMYLNDAFDVEFDRQRRAGRPIPSGRISRQAVWRLGGLWLGLGLACLFLAGPAAGWLGLVLAVFILIYDATHKVITAAPWLMGACRFWVYVIAGAASAAGLNGWSIFCGAALGVYVAGLSYLARRESSPGRPPRWPLACLAVPIVLALLMNHGKFLPPALGVALLLAAWLAIWLWQAFLAARPNPFLVVSNLLAGIVLVDWLAVAPVAGTWLTAVLLALFGLTLVLQQFVPAT